MKLEDAIDFNPTEKLAKNTYAKKIGMDKLSPFYKYIDSFEYEKYSGGAKFRNGDTIVARITPCLENGKTAYIDLLNDGEVAFGSTEFLVMRNKENVTIPEFVYYLSISPRFREKAISLMTGTSGRQRVQLEPLKEEKIYISSIRDQIKLVKILSAIDEKIKLNSKINNNLYEEAVALYKDKFKGIGQGKKTIGDYIVPKRGKNLLTRDAIDGDTPVVAGGIAPSAYHNQFNTKSPVITISASGANAGYTNLWNIPVWASDCSYIDDSITKNVYFWYIVLKTRQNEIFDAQTGSAQPHIYPQHIAEMSIGELNIAEVEKYNNLVAPLFKMIGEKQKENKKLSQLRDTLLPKLMNGEIDLDNIEI